MSVHAVGDGRDLFASISHPRCLPEATMRGRLRLARLVVPIAAVAAVVPAAAWAVPAAVIHLAPRPRPGDPPGTGPHGGTDAGHQDAVYGWNFTAAQPLTVTHLAWYDEQGDGLSHEHRVGI